MFTTLTASTVAEQAIGPGSDRPEGKKRMGRKIARMGAMLAVTGAFCAGCGSDAADSLTSSSVVASTAVTTPATPATDSPTTHGTHADSTDAPTTIESTAAPTTPTTAALPSANVVNVDLNEYSITMPTSLPSGPTTFTAMNMGTLEHHMTLIRLGDNETVGDLIGGLSKDPVTGLQQADLFAGPQSIAPGNTESATATLQPGEYVAMCVIPGSDGIPHAAKGMLTQFTVTGEKSDAAPAPEAPGITLMDYGFTLADGFTGQGVVRVENAGTQPHELAVYKVAEGKTFADATAFLMSDQSGPSPVIPAGGVTPMSPGSVAGTDLHLTSGTYVFVCFLPGTEHMTHLEKGMVREVVIP